MENSEIIKMGYAIQKYLIDSMLVDAKSKDLMLTLIEKNFFNQDYRRGLSLRNVL